MVWQEAFPPTGGPAFDAEDERERRLAAQARAGAEWALTALIARYQPTVVRYLTRLCGNQAQARRLAERIFQRMERRLHGPHGAENLRLWLLRACTEAGLDALRRPQSAPTPRLASSDVAGLLTEESGKDSQGVLHSGLRRLRQATGGTSQQARPLVWAEDPAAISAAAARGEPARGASENHLDETLDRLDPRDALRHRLVRVTLAELPYGDAQCLALHLVAGLNQAEVAKSLGLTNSAARKRIVHGLALFSDRYAQAVQSLGLPVELGFGDALPRPSVEPEPVAESAPEPVVVSSQAPARDERDEREARTAGEDRLIEVNRPLPEYSREVLSGVSYLSEDSGETPAVRPQTSAPESPYDGPYAEADAAGMAGAAERAHQSATVALDESSAEMRQTLLAEHDPAPVSGGLITRVASDAIIGPIVDALPVTSASAEATGMLGLHSPRSTPLAYELSSHTLQEAPGVTMNWLDATGLMTPLGFESIAIATADAATEDDATAADAPLTFEAAAFPADMPVRADEPAPAEADEADDEGAAMAYELAQASADEIGEPLGEPQVAESAQAQATAEEPLALVAEPAPLPPVTVPVVTAAAAEPPAGGANTLAAPRRPDQPEAVVFTPRPAGGVITRSLEDIWDELPDGADR
jgi:RNA polymerase sigma factor (sigma-70 family)